jgi:hypothetical protein
LRGGSAAAPLLNRELENLGTCRSPLWTLPWPEQSLPRPKPATSRSHPALRSLAGRVRLLPGLSGGGHLLLTTFLPLDSYLSETLGFVLVVRGVFWHPGLFPCPGCLDASRPFSEGLWYRNSQTNNATGLWLTSRRAGVRTGSPRRRGASPLPAGHSFERSDPRVLVLRCLHGSPASVRVHNRLDRAKGVSGPYRRTCGSERRRRPLRRRGRVIPGIPIPRDSRSRRAPSRGHHPGVGIRRGRRGRIPQYLHNVRNT